MGFRFGLFEQGFGLRNFEETRKLSKRLSQRVPEPVDRALGPNVSEDQACDDETKKDSNHAIADVIEVRIGRITLEDAVEESEGDLEAGIRNHFASGGDPAGDGRRTGDDHNE